MSRLIKISLCLALITLCQGCKIKYSFSGISTGDAETFQVNNFVNNAALVEPRIARDFTLALQDIILTQSSLALTPTNGDIIYEGEITRYYVAPITATSQSTAAQNRLTMEVNVRFFNTLDSEKDFEQKFSFYFDYEGGAQLIGSQLDEALEAIFERITQDIINKSLADW
ncbi:LptE family protein [Aureisphaera galaxeae]|uniref:LptE family protein n=1 Tax=Aureisphaera galaxeae TaxID=1538023 RepID=UPI00235087B9|nr:LptE family protein [Aureisphaera galaxeae]MDC8003074.1 LptE family protein [Aureisphaera galaxeae]